MIRRTFLLQMTMAVGFAGSANALSRADALIQKLRAQLRAQGFTSIKIKRTFLGRIRIIAISPKYKREIVLNPNTGEVLRDYSVDRRTGESVYSPEVTNSQTEVTSSTGEGGGGDNGDGDGGDNGDGDGGDGDGGDGDGGDGGDGDGDGGD